MTSDVENRDNLPRIDIQLKRRIVCDKQPQTSRSSERHAVKRPWHSRADGNQNVVGPGDFRDRYEDDKPKHDGKDQRTQRHDQVTPGELPKVRARGLERRASRRSPPATMG